MKYTMRIVCVAGGTGGHVFPSCALAEYLKNKDVHVDCITDQRGAQYASKDVFNQILIWHIARSSRLKYMTSLAMHGLKSLVYFIRNRPKAVIGFGGYPSLMPLLAAWILRIPVFIHEQNKNLGRANRFLSQFVKEVWVTHQTDLKHSFITGNFIRSHLRSVGSIEEPKSDQPLRILILGGSQGASILSEHIAHTLTKSQLNIEVTHQCRNSEAVQAIYTQNDIKNQVAPFFKDMTSLYQWAHLVISRSGASTVSEVKSSKRPAIWIPFKAAIESDQQFNAQSTSEWSWTVDENHIDLIPDILKSISDNPNILVKKSKLIPAHHQDEEHVWHTLLSL